ncbi:MAG: hypothetical protein V3U12_04375 [Nitrosopumilaceae archaeon]
MNSDFLKLNKTIILSGILAIILGNIAAYIFSDQQDYLLTTYTVIAEYIGFFGVIIPMFYWDNRHKYSLESGKKDKGRIKKDFIKLGASLGISEVFYLSSRWLSGFYLLQIGYDANTATIISEAIAFAIFIIAMNLGAKFTKLYKHQK